MNNEELNKGIEKASHVVANSWPGAIEPEDLQQELWVKILESEKYMKQMKESDPALRMEFLKRLGLQIAGRYVNDYELFSGNAFYGTDHVRKLLEAGVLTVAREDLGAMNETLTEFLDIHESFDSLKSKNKDQAQAIWSNFVDESFNKDSQASRRLLSRAVDHLTDLMNQAHRRRHAEYEEGTGTREIVSNEKARLIAQRQYTGKGEGYNTFAQ